MDRGRLTRLLVGRDERLAERFLLLAVGVSTATFGVLVLARSVWGRLPVFGDPFFVGAYLLETLLGVSLYAARNDGFLVTLVGTFLALSGYAVFFGLHYLLCLSSCPTLGERLSFGVLLAAGGALLVGSTAFAVGAGGRRLRARWS